MTTHDVIEAIIEREGGFVDSPLDRGGPTKFGVTMATLSHWTGGIVTPSDIKALTPEVAAQIYLRLYVQKPGFELINDDRLRGLVVDSAVHHGQATVIKWLQAIVEVEVDGVLGSTTTAAINSENAHSIYLLLIAKRIRYMGNIVHQDPSQVVFINGWLSRATKFVEEVA